MKRRPIRALALMLASLLACTGCGSANYETGAPDYTCLLYTSDAADD